jgi:hypothetical protein
MDGRRPWRRSSAANTADPAIVLSHLEPEQSASIPPLLTQEMRTDVLMRIVPFNEAPQSALTGRLSGRETGERCAAVLRWRQARTWRHLNAMERTRARELGKIEQADADASADRGPAVHFRPLTWMTAAYKRA